MKRVCVVGYGAIGPIHAKALHSINGAELYGICDTNAARLQSGVLTHQVKAFCNYRDVLADPLVDCVHICTPHYLHYEMICQALSAGKAVVSEKPVTMTKEQYCNLLKNESAKKVCVVLQNRFNPCVVKLKNIICEGKLGKVRGIKGIVTWHRARDYYNQDQWRGKWKTEGGGALINQSIHTFDLIGYLAGEIKTVSASMCNHSLQHVIEVEDTVTAHLLLENNITGIFFATNAFSDDSFPYVEVLFEHGCVQYMNGQLLIDGVVVEEDQKAVEGKTYWGTSHEELLRQYYERDWYFSAHDIKNTMFAMYAAYESAKQGSKIVEITD